MSRCSHGIADGIINGLILGFVAGATVCFIRSCHGRNLSAMANEGLRWAGSGAVLFGAVGALRHCL